jgi:hypothetical protein
MELIPVRIENGHAPQPLKTFIRRLIYLEALGAEFDEPRINVGHVEMNQPTHRTVPGVLGHEKREPVSRHLHEDREMWLEAVFPVNLEPEPANIKTLAGGIVGDSQRGHDPLRG